MGPYHVARPVLGPRGRRQESSISEPQRGQYGGALPPPEGVRPENTLRPSFLMRGRWQTRTGWPTSRDTWKRVGAPNTFGRWWRFLARIQSVFGLVVAPTRAAFAQTMGCSRGSAPRPDEEDEIARAGWGAEVSRWAVMGACGGSSLFSRGKTQKKAPTLPGSFYMIMLRTIGWVGRSALRTRRGASPPGPGTALSHLALELGPENQTMRAAVRRRIDQESRVY